MMSRALLVAQLKKEFEDAVEQATPEEVKRGRLFDLDQEGEIRVTLTKELIERLGLRAWLANYREEASHSTGGIRGPQNIKYWWDWRFPLHGLGVALATLGKARVLQQDIKGRAIRKALGCEVRYHSQWYMDLIARLQAAMGIETHTTPGRVTLPVWLASFIIFLDDYDGGEYVTSSHAISSKIATKDLDNQGSQFMPEMSLRFVQEIEKILDEAELEPEGVPLVLAPRAHPLIIEDLVGIDRYVDYLRQGVATEENIALMHTARTQGFRIMFEFLGGCMYRPMRQIWEQLGVADAFDWSRVEEDPFFHGVGKAHRVNPSTLREEFFDYSCDTTIMDVVRTMHFEELVSDKPVGYPILMTDPDGDRLVLAEVLEEDRQEVLNDLGIDFIPLKQGKIIAVYMPNQSFLITLDFHARQLKNSGKWAHHDRFMIKTTLSAAMWDEWASANDVAVVNVPVGFKEIAQVMKKVEKQLAADKRGFRQRADARINADIIVHDIYGETVNLGKDPRLLFGGEESGGMIMGPEELIISKGGKRALAMREKSAGEASVIVTALAAKLFTEGKTFLDYYLGFLDEYRIRYRYNVRGRVIYYNESEPNPAKLMAAKGEGERMRDKNDNYFLALAMARREGLISLVIAREILQEAFPSLQFSDLKEVHFVGDGTMLEFADKAVEVRKSGTDAVTRAAAFGVDRKECERYLNAFMNYRGDVTPLYERYLPPAFRASAPSRARESYLEFLRRE